MPTSLPVKRAIPAIPLRRATGPMDIWAVSLGLAAAALAAFVYFADSDSVAAALIMVAAAIIILVQLHVTRAKAPD
jgi:hypothetical protein